MFYMQFFKLLVFVVFQQNDEATVSVESAGSGDDEQLASPGLPDDGPAGKTAPAVSGPRQRRHSRYWQVTNTQVESGGGGIDWGTADWMQRRQQIESVS